MHELSIAHAVVTIASRHADGRKVTRVELKVGHLRQVVPDSLTFAFELVSAGTELDGAELVIDEVPARVICPACEAETVLEEFPAHCGACGGLDVEVAGGDELLVDALELDDGRLGGDAAASARAEAGQDDRRRPAWQQPVA
jgi:hydrogenase nickel incorporation protein HypA/HybF